MLNEIENDSTCGWINDLEREVDLYEEIARIYGYDNIPLSPVYTGSYTSFIKDKHKQTSTIKSALANLHLHRPLPP